MFWNMGLFDMLGARGAYDQVYGGGMPHHDITHELLAGAAGFEAVRMYEHHREREGIVEHHAAGKEMLAGLAAAEVDKHFDSGRFGHLDRGQARRQAMEQADHLWQQHHGRY
jgi:Protein of unknown function (DUF3759)